MGISIRKVTGEANQFFPISKDEKVRVVLIEKIGQKRTELKIGACGAMDSAFLAFCPNWPLLD